ncbi:MAG: HEAT repeat domain-containing protein [Chloroflexi bacterium]|nr:HEAT repeat domain-containing protein [Chloroflexota bacterium]
MESLITVCSYPALMSDCDFDTAASICDALGAFGDSRAVDPLIRLMFVSEPLRPRAAAALTKLGEARLAQALTGSLEGEPDRIQELRRIVANGDLRPLNNLLWALQGDPEVQIRACGLLGAIGDRRATPKLIQHLYSNGKTSVAVAACAALGELADQRAAKELLNALLRDPRATDAMVRLLDNDTDDVVKGLCEGLINLADRTASDEIVGSLTRRMQALRHRPAAAYGSREWESYSAHVHSERSCVAAMCDALGRLGDPSAVEPLVAVLRDSDSRCTDVLWAAGRALGTLRDARAVPVLLAIFTDADGASDAPFVQTRSSAEYALLAFGVETLAEQAIALARNGDLRGVKAVGRLRQRFSNDDQIARHWQQFLRKVHEGVRPLLNGLLCPSCLVRVEETRENWAGGIRWFACRACGRLAGFLSGVTELVAVLDDAWNDEIEIEDTTGTLRANWLQRRALFDFNRLEILSASDYEVERLLIAVGNDADEWRRGRYTAVSCTVECRLSENTLRNLRTAFGGETRRARSGNPAAGCDFAGHDSGAKSCPNCGLPYRESEYRRKAVVWKCSACKESLPRTSRLQDAERGNPSKEDAAGRGGGGYGVAEGDSKAEG